MRDRFVASASVIYRDKYLKHLYCIFAYRPEDLRYGQEKHLGFWITHQQMTELLQVTCLEKNLMYVKQMTA